MAKLRVHNFSISLDGYGAGPDQSRENPLGVGGEDLHEWFTPTKTFRDIYEMGGGEKGIDDDFASRMWKGIGATIMGRNMFGPLRGEWDDPSWKGWWGDDPPYHHPVFVLTHHPREPIPMEGGTTFSFVSGGIQEAREQAVAAAAGQDVLVAGGASTIRQFLEAGLIDELHIAIAPILLGEGEALFEGLDLDALGYQVEEFNGSPSAAHAVLVRRELA